MLHDYASINCNYEINVGESSYIQTTITGLQRCASLISVKQPCAAVFLQLDFHDFFETCIFFSLSLTLTQRVTTK